MNTDTSCQQCFSNFKKALDKLSETVDYIETSLAEKLASSLPEYSLVIEDIIKDGLIQRFEYTHELACRVMQDYTADQVDYSMANCENTIQEGLRLRLITDGPLWIDMLTTREKTLKSFHEEVATDIYNRILGDYYYAFLDFRDLMKIKMEASKSE